MTEINKVHIYAPQDPSVGLFSVHLVIDLNNYETDDIEFVRQELKSCFDALYDDDCRVTFDFEFIL